MNGTEWIESVRHLGSNRPAVMKAVLKAVDNGNAIEWPMQRIDVGEISFFASMDYFSIGEPTNFVRVPIDPLTATRIADQLGYFPMPTSAMVNHVWLAADLKLQPLPMSGPKYPYDSSMMSVDRFAEHNEWIEEQLTGIAEQVFMAKILAGHKKDIVLSNSISQGRMGLYGLHRPDGTVIQGPSVSTTHIDSYYDYIHGWRMIGRMARAGGVEVPLSEVLQDETICAPLCKEPVKGGGYDMGPLMMLRYPPPTNAPKPKIVSAVNTKTPADDPDSIHADSFKQARNYTKANRKEIKRIIIHTMEAAEHPKTAENVQSWFAGPHAPRGSAHYNIDCDSIAQSVREKDIAWHAKGDNKKTIGFEHAGYHYQDDADWADAYSLQMLEKSAQLCADVCNRHGIPIRYIDESQVAMDEPGITFHVDVTEAFEVIGGHVDPGKHFPIDKYIAMVKAFSL